MYICTLIMIDVDIDIDIPLALAFYSRDVHTHRCIAILQS